jgi:hypothetical protein
MIRRGHVSKDILMHDPAIDLYNIILSASFFLLSQEMKFQELENLSSGYQ